MSEHRSLGGIEAMVLRLGPGEDLFTELRSFVIDGDWQEAVIAGAAGSFDKAVVCYPKGATLPPIVERTGLDGVFEISSLSGNARRLEDGSVHVHIHGSFAENGVKVYGGAIGEGTRVFKMADLFLLGTR